MPKIVATLGSVFIVYQILSRFEINKDDFKILIFTLTGLSFATMFASGWKRKRKLVKFEKIWLFEEIISNAAYVNFIVLYILHFALDVLNKFFTEIYSYTILLSIIAVLYLIFVYIIQFVIPSKAQEYLKQTYPEYEFAK